MSVLEAAIGLLAPPTCIYCAAEGMTLCTKCADSRITIFGERCWRCTAISKDARTCLNCRHAGSMRSVWIAAVFEEAAKDLLQKYKYGHQRIAAQSIARLMVDHILSLNNLEKLRKSNYIIVPVATASSRVRQRGFDHSSLLGRAISRKLKLPFSSALIRIGQTRQVGTPRSLRLTQPQGSYKVTKHKLVKDQNILLIDDVITTGATLNAASQALRQAGARHVDALVFAKKL